MQGCDVLGISMYIKEKDAAPRFMNEKMMNVDFKLVRTAAYVHLIHKKCSLPGSMVGQVDTHTTPPSADR